MRETPESPSAEQAGPEAGTDMMEGLRRQMEEFAKKLEELSAH